MNAFYSSDADFAWGKVTLKEIKKHVKDEPPKKPQKRYSTSNLSHNFKEAMGSSVTNSNSTLKDITNKCNISGTSTQYFTANDTFKSGTKNSSYMDLPRIHVHPELMLDNFQATLVNNTILSDDAGCDVSVLSSGNICTPHKDFETSIILISDDDSEEQNGDQNSFDFKQCSFDRLSKLKCEHLSNYEADTSDYHENVPLESEDVSEGRLNTTDCISLSSIDEDSENCMSSTNRDNEYVILQEVSQQIQESFCGHYDSNLGNEMESMTHIGCQSRSEIDSMPQSDYQPGNQICYAECHDCGEQTDVPQNTLKDVNVSRHRSSEWDSSTPEKNMRGDIHINHNICQDAQEKFESESPNNYFGNDSCDESDGLHLDKSNDSNNKEEFDNTLEMVERMLNKQLEITNKSVNNKNEKMSTSMEESRIPRLLKSPHIGDTFKVPQSIQKKKLQTPKSASKLNFKDVVSPVGLYIKYSPQPVLKQNVNAVEFKSPAFMKKMSTSPQVSKPNRSNCQDFPTAIYKPSGKQVTSSAKKLFMPPSLEKMVREPKMVKHEGRINPHHNKSDIDTVLCEAELTRCSISDSVLDSSVQDISVLTVKHTFT